MPALEDVLYSGQISIGPPVEEFEAAFGRHFDLDHVTAVSSGTAGLHLALLLAGVKPGDEVISTAMTAEPSNLAILHAGGQIVWADIDRDNGNISPASVRERISPRTKAILAVDYGGVPVDLAGLGALAREHGIPLIEDAAHALGARYDGRPVGSHADFVVFSLQAIKHMTTIDGGVLVCRDEAAHERAKLLRWFGIDRDRSRTEVDVAEAGFKYNMNNVTATIGLVSLRHIAAAIARHIENGTFFDAALQGIDRLEPCRWDARAEPSYWFYTLLADRRDDLIAHLGANGVAAGLVHARNDTHSVFAASRRPLPELDSFSQRYLHIPCGWWVRDDDRERIVELIREGW